MIEDKIQKETLSIRISTNGFCFCSYTPSQPDSLQYFSFEPKADTTLAANLKAAIEECPFDIKKHEVKAIIETSEYTMLPAEYDDRRDYKLFYRYCFPKSNSNIEIISNRLNAHNLSVLFSVDKSAYETLQQFETVTYYTPTSILAGYLTRCPLPEEHYMLAYMNNGHTHLLSIKNGIIGICNVFKCDNNNNALFYLLSTWKEQGLSQTDDTLYICGDESIEQFEPECRRFIKNIRRLNPNKLFKPSLLNKLKNIPFDLQRIFQLV